MYHVKYVKVTWTILYILHENHCCPSSLSQMDKLRSGCKSDLLDFLQKLCPAQDDAPDVDVLILDGAAIVSMLKPTACQTFLHHPD